jgi:hypothetical protein
LEAHALAVLCGLGTNFSASFLPSAAAYPSVTAGWFRLKPCNMLSATNPCQHITKIVLFLIFLCYN